MCSHAGVSVCVQVLNEVVVDRGPSSYLSNVDLYLDGRLITSVQGDGKICYSLVSCHVTLLPWLVTAQSYRHRGDLLYVQIKQIWSPPSLPPAGVIVSTPTGSTAYAAAAGASMIHPNVPAIMVTPICPHSLSFRPIVVPAGVELMVGRKFSAYILFTADKWQKNTTVS